MCRRFPGEAHAPDGAVRDAGIQAADFGEHLAAGGEAVGAGVGAGEVGQGGEAFDGGDADAAQTRDEGALAGLDAGVAPEADGLGLSAGADEAEEAGFEEEHGSMVTREADGENFGTKTLSARRHEAHQGTRREFTTEPQRDRAATKIEPRRDDDTTIFNSESTEATEDTKRRRDHVRYHMEHTSYFYLRVCCDFVIQKDGGRTENFRFQISETKDGRRATGDGRQRVTGKS